MLFIERACLVKAWLHTVIWSFVSNVALPFTVAWTVAESHLDRTSSGEGSWCWIVQVLVLRSGLKFWLCFVLSVKSCLSKSSVFRVWGPLCDYQDLLVCKETHLCSSSPTVGLLDVWTRASTPPREHSAGTGFCFFYSRALWWKPSLEVRLLLYRQEHWAKIGTSLHPSICW